MSSLKPTAVGISTGAIIPKEVLARLGVGEGDTLYLTETADGAYHLTACDPEFAGRMAKADDIMSRDRNTLHALAK